MAVLNRDDFLKVMKRRNDEHFRAKAQFIVKVPFFKKLSLYLAMQLAEQQVEENYYRNQIISNQGDIPSKIYIVQDGEFELTRQKKTKQYANEPQWNQSASLTDSHGQLSKFLGSSGSARKIEKKHTTSK